MIKDRFHDCAEGNRALLVSVAGVAGIGKSRLAWEFYKYFDGIAQITYWHRGRCLSYGEGVTYWALADMVRMRCRIAEDEAPASALAKLREIVEEHIHEEEERRFVEPRVAHLLGLEDGSRYERDDLFAAWRVFFERLTAVYPVVMVFEDMQWGDDSLLDFIEYLLEWSRESPLFVVTLARPELQERRPTWGAGRRNFTSLYLEPLPVAAMEQLLERARARSAGGGACTDPRPRGGYPALRRRDRAHAARPRSARRGRRRLPSDRADRVARRARDAARPDRRAPRRAAPRGAQGASGRRRASARRSCRGRSPRSRASRRTSCSRFCRRSCAKR